jgi:hypothetical protein
VITGTGLGAALGVTIGGPGRPRSPRIQPTRLPSGLAGPADVTVATVGGAATTTVGFNYLGAPATTLVTPATGPDTGGTAVTVTGTGFTNGVTAVTVGRRAATAVSELSAISMLVVTPPGPVGPVVIQALSSVGDSVATPNVTYPHLGGAPSNSGGSDLAALRAGAGVERAPRGRQECAAAVDVDPIADSCNGDGDPAGTASWRARLPVGRGCSLGAAGRNFPYGHGIVVKRVGGTDRFAAAAAAIAAAAGDRP